MDTDPKQLNYLLIAVGMFGVFVIIFVFYGIFYFFRKQNKVTEKIFFCRKCMNQVEEHELVEDNEQLICVKCFTGNELIAADSSEKKVAYCPKCRKEIELMAIKCEHCDYTFDDEQY